MELGMIGLGKMGGFMAERLVRGGRGFDRQADWAAHGASRRMDHGAFRQASR
jgi:3-hydroxyisobutyrate dehydrogenase-like beta-hydroxyacid dehydrogenase